MERLLASVPLYVVLPVVLILVVLLVFLIVRAFSEGREISFWPPKIGARPSSSDGTGLTLSKPQLNESAKTPVPTVNDSQVSHEAPKSADSHVSHVPPKSDESRISHVARVSTSQGRIVDLDLGTIRTLGEISKTRYSTIERCVLQGDDNYVLKGTKLAFCQPETLKRLAGKQMVGSEKDLSATIATPIAVWTDTDYVYELHPYYAGISLLELILRNKYRIRGKFLGAIYNSLVQAIHEMHKEGIIHRDIAPSNILLTPTGNLVLMDCSFCCAEGPPQVPVENPAYTPPEQLRGQASFGSDWFSLAATIFFLANGCVPDPSDVQLLRSGLMNISTGNYGVSPIFKKMGFMTGPTWSVAPLFEALLHADVLERPSEFGEVLLFTGSYPAGFDVVLGILDTGEFGYVVTEEYDFCLTPKRKVSAILSKALLGEIEDPGLLQDAKAIVERDEWDVLKPT